jgi:hypothetical protein
VFVYFVKGSTTATESEEEKEVVVKKKARKVRMSVVEIYCGK